MIPKTEMIERSLRCYVLGLLGLIPVLGLIPAILALREHRRVKKGSANQWNPARRYHLWGGICARTAIPLWGIPIGLALCAFVYSLFFSSPVDSWR